MSMPNLTDMNIEKIGALFPNVITETRDENGNIKRAVDFDLLKQVLSKSLVEDENERYRLDWPGKKASLLKANTPINKTLRPYSEESVNFNTTENLYLEGDNYEVLKILQESYLGKIKMIYIDPPYNTGNDFIYKDNFSKNKDEYEQDFGLTDIEGGKLFRNTDTNGRYHSDWLSMMYERLLIARDLLRDDGVIFISIDDNEMHNLRKICDEVFGEENFVGNIAWESKTKSQNTKTAYNKLQPKVEHILVITKSDYRRFNLISIGQKDYPETDEKGSFRYYKIELMNSEGIRGRNTMVFTILGVDPPGGKQWKLGSETINGFKERGDLTLFKGEPTLKMRSDDERNDVTEPFWGFISKEIGTAESAKKELTETMGTTAHGFESVKPVALIKKLIFHSTSINDTILDFFSGSGTTAHAVMQLNADDGGNRKFIMVQLPEPCDENSEAFKAGYKTIAEIGKERIRRAGNKIVEDLKSKNQQLELGDDPVDLNRLDIGFRVYKSDTSNMKDVFYHPSELDQKMLSSLESNIKENRTPEDLLTQVILDLGLELTLPIENNQILDNTVFFVQTNALVACFDESVDFNIVDHIADYKPLRVVFRDASFVDDKDRINVEERFKRLSPETKVTVV